MNSTDEFDFNLLTASEAGPLTGAEIRNAPKGLVVLWDSACPMRFANDEGAERLVEPWLFGTREKPWGGIWGNPRQVDFPNDPRIPIAMGSCISPNFTLPKLPRLSCALTTAAVVARTKTVTRRLKRPVWAKEASVAAGRPFLLVDRSRSFKGGRPQGLALARLVSVRAERLEEITDEDVRLEGFEQLDARGFVEFFCDNTGCDLQTTVYRLEWRYL